MSSLFDFSLYESFTLIGIWFGLVGILIFFIFLFIKLDDVYDSIIYQIIKTIFTLLLFPLPLAIIALPSIWLFELIGYWSLLVMFILIGLFYSIIFRIFDKKNSKQ